MHRRTHTTHAHTRTHTQTHMCANTHTNFHTHTNIHTHTHTQNIVAAQKSNQMTLHPQIKLVQCQWRRVRF